MTLIKAIRYLLAPRELKDKAHELSRLKCAITEVEHYCAYDSPPIGFAMLRLQRVETQPELISHFRDRLRAGRFTFSRYVAEREAGRPV